MNQPHMNFWSLLGICKEGIRTSVYLQRACCSSMGEFTDVTFWRRFTPNDANSYGTVHGGVILRFIEDAGNIVAERFCNHKKSTYIRTANCRIEHTDFLKPIELNEVAKINASVVFTAHRSLAVNVEVFTSDLAKDMVLSNRSTLWYVGYERSDYMNGIVPIEVPKIETENMPQYEKFLQLYEKNKAEREIYEARRAEVIEDLRNLKLYPLASAIPQTERKTVNSSITTMYMIVKSKDCSFDSILTGGNLLKLMDECGAITAVKHCGVPVFTGCIEAVNFNTPAKQGEAVLILSRLTFVSRRSLEVEIFGFVENFQNHEKSRLVCSSFFTYVAVPGTIEAVPELIISTETERKRFNEGKIRLENRRVERFNT